MPEVTTNTTIRWAGRELGARKSAAKRAGVSFEEYCERVAANQKRCIRCREWRSVDDFCSDASRTDGRSAKCRTCAAELAKATYVPVVHDPDWRPGPERIPARDGDKKQARRRINHDVRLGLRPHPNTLHCAYCGHKGEDRRHEYHHHMGYAAIHHNDVVAACSACHHREESKSRSGDNARAA